MKDAATSLNVKPGTYRTWEHAPGTEGGRLPTISELQRVCKKFKVSWTWVLSGEGSPDQENAPHNLLTVFESKLDAVPEEQRDAAITAALGVFDAFSRKAG